MSRPLLGWNGALALVGVSLMSALTDLLLLPLQVWDDIAMALEDDPYEMEEN